MAYLLPPPTKDWYCPACGLTDRTQQHGYHVRYHTCPKTRMLSIAMLPKGTAGKIVVHEREEYVGSEIVQYDPERGRPIVSAETIRDNGNDLIVFAPMATGTAER